MPLFGSFLKWYRNRQPQTVGAVLSRLDLGYFYSLKVNGFMHKLEKQWPFRLGTTSFIYPDFIVPNVKKLGAFFDEIELLIFESKPSTVLPTHDEIRELTHLAGDLNLTYNIHLPTDISLGHPDSKIRVKAVDTVWRVVELCEPLSPTTHTLHLDLQAAGVMDLVNGISEWQQLVDESLFLLSSHFSDMSVISIENLDFPFDYLENLIETHGLAVCMDAGHLLVHGFDFKAFFEKHQSRIPLIHLHGVDMTTAPPKDHQALDRTPAPLMASLMEVLNRFTGVVSLEVFNLEKLEASLACLDQLFPKNRHGRSMKLIPGHNEE